MKSQKLTPKEKEIFDLLTQLKTGCLRKHVKPSGLICYRILDDSFNPVSNVSQRYIDQLKDKEVIEEAENGKYVLVATNETKTMDLNNLGLAKRMV